ncbi:MAG: hypothetical protein ACYT04_71940 [Nostoc sp.]
MEALPQILRLQSLESIIERSQQMIVPETPLLDAMSTMVTELAEVRATPTH